MLTLGVEINEGNWPFLILTFYPELCLKLSQTNPNLTKTYPEHILKLSQINPKPMLNLLQTPEVIWN